MGKIIHIIIVSTLLILLVYTRFFNLGWGLPYPMHPDERNMADAILRMECDRPSELIKGLISYAPRNVITYLQHGQFALPDWKVECLNPHFFAYGQLSLFIGYILGNDMNVIGKLMGNIRQGNVISFPEAVMGLRLLSAFASSITPFVLLRILILLNPLFRRRLFAYCALLCFIFSPILIQLAHFGTTEAVLMLWYSVLTYFAIIAVRRKRLYLKDLILMAIVCGLAIATKASSLIYLAIPYMIVVTKAFSAFALRLDHISSNRYAKSSPTASCIDTNDVGMGDISEKPRNDMLSYSCALVMFSLREFVSIGFFMIFITLVAGITSFLFSPHNFISLRELLGSMHYEADVGLGNTIPFYTRQFLLELPVLFQMQRIFPFILGYPVLIFALTGIVFLPFNRSYNMLRFAILSYGVLTMSWYAKWTRFLGPIYPIMIALAVLMILSIYQKFISRRFSRKVAYGIGMALILAFIIPGVAFMSVYTNRDIRFVASEWVYNNIPAGSYILSETANVIDIPIPDVRNKASIPDGYNIQYLSFNSYEVDADPRLRADLQDAIQQADYIFVPSRRVFYNHTCVDLTGKVITTRHSKDKCAYLARTYPVLKKYYEDLFSGKSGFKQVAEFTSYPRLELFGRTILEFPDESAEETFTVFDHPVIRIYKRYPNTTHSPRL